MEIRSKRLDDASDDSRDVSRSKRRIHGEKSSWNPHSDSILPSILISYTCPLNATRLTTWGDGGDLKSVIVFMLVQRGGAQVTMRSRAAVHYRRLHLSLNSPSLS